MGVKLNLTQAEIKQAQGIFEALPAGVYPAAVFEAKDAISKSSGNPMYTVTYKITEGEGKGRKFTSYYSHSAKAWFKSRELFKATGHLDLIKAAEAGEEFEFPTVEELDILGAEVNLKLIIEEYESVDDDDNDIIRERNVADKVFAYDESKLSVNADAEGAAGNNFLGL